MAGCGDNPGLPEDTSAAVRYPIAMAATPSGSLVFAVGANFDRAYRGGKLRVIDTATDAFVPGQLEVSGFAGGIALQMPLAGTPTEQVPQRVLVTSRDDDAISIADFTAPTVSLSCGTHDVDGHCDASHRYGLPTSTPPLGNDPMGIEIIPWDAGHWRVTVATSVSGHASVLQMDTVGKIANVGQVGLGTGLYAVKTVPATGRTYVSSINSPAIYVLRVDPDATAATGYKATTEPSVVLPSQSALSYARGLALSSDGARLYVADRSPTALIEIDVSPGPSGAPRNAVGAVIPLGPLPSEVAVAPTGPGGRDLVYVSCFGDDAVWVVDPYLREVVDIIRFHHAPYALTATKVPGLDAAGKPQGWKLYTGLFAAHTIAVVPLEPSSPARHTITKLLAGSP